MTAAWYLGAILGLGVLAALERRRRRRNRLPLRIVAGGLALLALLVLAATSGDTAGVLTLRTPGARAGPVHGAEVSLGALLASGDRPRAIRVAGWGLLDHEWPDSLAVPVSFEPPHLPAGIVALEAPAEVGVGEVLVVTGRVELGGRDSGRVVLENPAGPCDSDVVTPARPRFRLSDRPRASGATSYRLRLVATGLPPAAETLGVAVRDRRPPSVLALNASPSFETTFLKHWLSDRGGTVAVRTDISRGRMRRERWNDPPGSGSLATSFARFDLVLADPASLARLSRPERSALDRAVRQDGVGLLLQGAAGGGEFAEGFGLDRIADLDERRVRPVWRDQPQPSRVAIAADPAVLRPDPAVHALMDDGSGGGVLAGWRSAGRGRIGVTLLRAPSRWQLEGETAMFAGYWSELLETLARDTATRVALQADGAPYPGQPIRVELTTMAARPVARVVSPAGTTDTLALARDPVDTLRWTGRYWPRQSGWHRLGLGPGRWMPFRVAAAGEWRSLEAHARVAATRFRAGRRPAGAPSERIRLAGFLLLLFALAALWIEERTGGRS